MLRSLLALAVASVFSFGCVAAPRTVETTLELGPKEVQIDVRLNDIRAFAADDLNQLRVFNAHARWNPEWVDEMPWAPAPTRYEFSSDGGRLDLAMHGVMPRADFDRCVQPGADGGVAACPSFPLELRKFRYALSDEVLHSKSITIDPKAITSWPANTGRIIFRCAISASEARFIEDGPSLALGFERQRQDPAGAAATIEKLKATEERFVQGKAAEWTAVLADLEACHQEPWCGLRQEHARRQQLHLAHAYLTNRPEAGTGLRPPPEDHDGFFTNPYVALVPKDRFAPIDELRLRVAYDVQLDEFREQLRLPTTGWTSVCRPETVKKPALKDFCLRLGAKAAAK